MTLRDQATMFVRITAVIVTGTFVASLAAGDPLPASPASAVAAASSPKELLNRAELTGEARDIEAAARAIGAALKNTPADYPLRRLQARLLMTQGNVAAARDLAAGLHREMMDDLEVYALLAESESRLGNLAAAEKHVQWMLDLRPEDPMSLLAAADVRARLKMHEGALQFYSEAVKRFPPLDKMHRAQALARASASFLALGKREGARFAAADALALAPESHEARQALLKTKEVQN